MAISWYKNTEEEKAAMARKKKEKDIPDQILDTIDFKGLTLDEEVGQGGLGPIPKQRFFPHFPVS